jgi:hypothetical protein
MKRTHKVEPLPECPCAVIIRMSREMFPSKDIDERQLYAWDCPLHAGKRGHNETKQHKESGEET